MKTKKITIAIDGYSSCGKSTLAKDLAAELGYIFIDSGAMYRAVTYYALENKLIEGSAINLEKLEAHLQDIQLEFRSVPGYDKPILFMNGQNVEEAIRQPEINALVSNIAVIESVRTKLVDEQRKMGKLGGIVMDGRDIGSVVFPDAELKLFVTADISTRTERRFEELQQKGISITKDEVQANLIERDHIDSTRKISPLTQVEDAIVIDNSHLTRQEQLNLALELVSERSQVSIK